MSFSIMPQPVIEQCVIDLLNAAADEGVTLCQVAEVKDYQEWEYLCEKFENGYSARDVFTICHEIYNAR